MEDCRPGYPAMSSPSAAAGAESSDPVAFQKNMSRAFIQSAVAQNMQIQQQLMAQNQALQHLLHQSVRHCFFKIYFMFIFCYYLIFHLITMFQCKNMFKKIYFHFFQMIIF